MMIRALFCFWLLSSCAFGATANADVEEQVLLLDEAVVAALQRYRGDVLAVNAAESANIYQIRLLSYTGVVHNLRVCMRESRIIVMEVPGESTSRRRSGCIENATKDQFNGGGLCC